jgi:hypothetical protein
MMGELCGGGEGVVERENRGRRVFGEMEELYEDELVEGRAWLVGGKAVRAMLNGSTLYPVRSSKGPQLIPRPAFAKERSRGVHWLAADEVNSE